MPNIQIENFDNSDDKQDPITNDNIDESENNHKLEEEKEYYSDIEEGSASGGIDEATKKSIRTFIWWGMAFVATVVAFTVSTLAILAYFNVNYIKVHGESMEPTFYHSDGLFISTRDHDPKTGNLVIFSEPENWTSYISREFNTNPNISEALTDGERYFIKRAVATPGDTINIEDSQVSVNDEIIVDKQGGKSCQNDDIEYTLQDGEYFMMGDNTGNSTDAYALYCRGSSIDGVLVDREKIVYYGDPVLIIPDGWGWFERE